MILLLSANNRCKCALAALLLLAVLGSGGFSVQAAPAGRLPHLPAQEPSAAEPTLPVFELHSGFWVNLHHFLYLQARLMKGNPGSAETGRGASSPDELPVSLIDFRA